MGHNINFYLEKTLSGSPSDIALLLKYLYYPKIRFDLKYWYHFYNHVWNISEEEHSPFFSILKNDLINKYLELANEYNHEVILYTKKYDISYDFHDGEFLPLIINDLIYKSKLCSEISLKLSNHSFCLKINAIVQELFTDKSFSPNMDLNPNLIGFNNIIYNLQSNSIEVPIHTHKVMFSTGYDYYNDSSHAKDIRNFFTNLNLLDALPSIAYLLHGHRRQPLICIQNLTDHSFNALSQLFEWTFGDYLGHLPFTVLRKRKIPSKQTHADLVSNCKKRIILVKHYLNDYPNVNQHMIDVLLTQSTLKLRKPYELSNNYTPQFGIIILSQKSNLDSMKFAQVFNANHVKDIPYKEDWKLDFMKLLLSYRT